MPDEVCQLGISRNRGHGGQKNDQATNDAGIIIYIRPMSTLCVELHAFIEGEAAATSRYRRIG